MRHFYCSVYSKDRAYQGVVLYKSLAKHDQEFKIFIICLDKSLIQFFEGLGFNNLIPISVQDIEESYKELIEIKELRNKNEYAWTLKPSILLHILSNFHEVKHIIWLDGDMKFFSDPKPIFDEWAAFSILLTRQYYTGPYEYLVDTYGRYQAGFIGFRKDRNSLRCLKWWQAKCIEWCHDKPDNGRWADQKYLDEWPRRFNNVGVVNNLGINMTPFTLYRLNTEQGKVVVNKGNELYIDDVKLILYHYYGFRCYKGRNYDLCCYWMKFTKETITFIYIPYIKECEESIKDINRYFHGQFNLHSLKGKTAMNYFSMVPPPTNTSS